MAFEEFLKSVGAAVGVGGATVAIALEMQPEVWGRGSFAYGPYAHACGEIAMGRVVITGGTITQSINELTVCATEHWTTTDSDNRTENHYRSHNQVEIARAFPLAPGQAFEGAFRVLLPFPAAITHNWAITTRLGIAGAPDAHGAAPIALLPPAYAQGLDACLLAAAPFTRRGIGFSTDGRLDFDYAPPAQLTGELDGVKLEFAPPPPAPGDGAITGSLEINPQEKTFADRIKSLTHGDRVRHPFSFTRALLETASPRVTDNPCPEVVAFLRGLLAPYTGASR